MDKYTKEELTEALRAVSSVIHKCEKAQEKFPGGTSHHTLLKNRLKAVLKNAKSYFNNQMI